MKASNALLVGILTGALGGYAAGVTGLSSNITGLIQPLKPAYSVRQDYSVKPYLIYPADMQASPKYEKAVSDVVRELQQWYEKEVGKPLSMQPLQVINSKMGSMAIRCGPSPTEQCWHYKDITESNVSSHANRAIHDGAERWDNYTVALVFFAGTGNFIGVNRFVKDTGYAILGEAVLETLSGGEKLQGVCYISRQPCTVNNAKGVAIWALGAALGLTIPYGPNDYPGKSAINTPWDFPNVMLLPFEVDQLRKYSPFFTDDRQPSRTRTPQPTEKPYPTRTPSPTSTPAPTRTPTTQPTATRAPSMTPVPTVTLIPWRSGAALNRENFLTSDETLEMRDLVQMVMASR